MTKYKIGQTVRCIEGGEKGAYWILGREFIVNRINETQEMNYYFSVRGNGVYEDSLELVQEPKTMNEDYLQTYFKNADQSTSIGEHLHALNKLLSKIVENTTPDIINVENRKFSTGQENHE